jgi:hypothetical protein
MRSAVFPGACIVVLHAGAVFGENRVLPQPERCTNSTGFQGSMIDGECSVAEGWSAQAGERDTIVQFFRWPKCLGVKEAWLLRSIDLRTPLDAAGKKEAVHWGLLAASFGDFDLLSSETKAPAIPGEGAFVTFRADNEATNNEVLLATYLQSDSAAFVALTKSEKDTTLDHWACHLDFVEELDDSDLDQILYSTRVHVGGYF